MIVIDTLRADHLGCYGYPKQTTPNIDKLARDGVVFERCYSTSSWTLPACASLLTGLYAEVHGVEQWQSVLGDHLPFLPDILGREGYYTAGVSSNPFLTSKQGFGRGFDVFDDTTVMAAAEWSFPLVGGKYKAAVLASTGATTTRRAIELLNDRPNDKPFFLLAHYMDCHADYLPPSPFDRKFDPDYTGQITGHVQSRRFKTDLDKRDIEHIISLYDGEIAYVDAQIGRLIDHLAALDLIQNTCILLTADHGEELLEHGNWGHGHTLYEECVRVPLLIHWPKQVPAKGRIAVPASIVDILPTVLALVGIARPAACLGADLGSLMKGKSRQPDRPIIMETSLGGRLWAMISGSQKLILPVPQISETQPAFATDRVLVFDLADNPKEDAKKTITDARQREALRARYCAVVADLAKTTQTLSGRAKNSLESDDEHLGRLRSLGYLGD